MLKVHGLKKSFAGIRAVDGVGFEVAAGECVALIGPNGAGKSTCFACIAGQYAPDSGDVRWQGERINRFSPAARLRAGVARTFQVAQVFEALTVLQNVQLALTALQGSAAMSGFKKLASQATFDAADLLAQTGLTACADSDAGRLPYGAKKRLELAIALAAKPGLLLLDEPAAGLAIEERASLMKQVKALAGAGMAILYTEHNMDAVAGVADRVLVLMEGQLVAQGSFEAIASNPLVRSRYLGSDASSGGYPGSGHA